MLFFSFFDNIDNRGGGSLNIRASRKDFFYIIVLILTFITVVIGLTFAIYNWIFSQKKGTSAVYTGTLTIEYLSGNIIDFHLLFPIDEPSFDTVDNVYRNNFRVTNTGSLDGIVKVDLNILSNEFSDNTLKYVLFNSNGDELTSGYINGVATMTIVDNVSLESNVTESYVLIVWLNENYQNQNQDMMKKMMGTIVVEASQQKD